jgi:hypothetical protein
MRFHDIPWDNGDTLEWLDGLFQIAGLGTLRGNGRVPPVLGDDLVWAIENIHKYPEPEISEERSGKEETDHDSGEYAEENVESLDYTAGGNTSKTWVIIERVKKDRLAFI